MRPVHTPRTLWMQSDNYAVGGLREGTVWLVLALNSPCLILGKQVCLLGELSEWKVTSPQDWDCSPLFFPILRCENYVKL